MHFDLFDPNGDAIISLPPELDLEKEGFGVVEQGVRNLVHVLWNLGYKTVCSCAGHENDLSRTLGLPSL